MPLGFLPEMSMFRLLVVGVGLVVVLALAPCGVAEEPAAPGWPVQNTPGLDAIADKLTGGTVETRREAAFAPGATGSRRIGLLQQGCCSALYSRTRTPAFVNWPLLPWATWGLTARSP